jgi:hypothetical protein
MTYPAFLCIWVGFASTRFSFTVMKSNNSNVVVANLSFDDDLILIVVVAVVVVVVTGPVAVWHERCWCQ